MKIFIICSLSAVGLLAAPHSFAQSSTGLQSATSVHQFRIAETDLNTKAVQYFKQANPSVTEEVWSKTNEGTRVSFSADGRNVWENYNRKGKWISTITNIPLSEVPEEIQSAIHAAYPSFVIFLIQQVKTGPGSVHVVKIENETSVKTLRIIKGQTELMEEKKK